MDVHVLLKQSGLFLELISLPQSQPVKILHCHTKHLDELLWGQVTLRTQGKRQNMVITSYLSLFQLNVTFHLALLAIIKSWLAKKNGYRNEKECSVLSTELDVVSKKNPIIFSLDIDNNLQNSQFLRRFLLRCNWAYSVIYILYLLYTYIIYSKISATVNDWTTEVLPSTYCSSPTGTFKTYFQSGSVDIFG